MTPMALVHDVHDVRSFMTSVPSRHSGVSSHGVIAGLPRFMPSRFVHEVQIMPSRAFQKIHICIESEIQVHV